MNYVRTKVSGQKQRLIQGKYNLDLTYITPRIVAMGFPGSGLQLIYRNNLKEVADYFNETHPHKFLIVNISENTYDANKFQGNVLHINKWQDHHAPPLHLLFELIEKVFGFLFISTSNIVVINCNAGKGRTGSLICSFLLYSKYFTNIQDAFDYYSLKRFKKGHGLTHASQRRYVNYFFKILQSDKYPIPVVRKLKCIKINLVPYDNITHIVPEYYIYNNSNELLHSNNKEEKTPIEVVNGNEIVFMNLTEGITVYGDILIELFHLKGIFSKKKKLGRISFNTSFIDVNSNEVIFKLNEIDPYEFIIKPNVNKQYEIILIFEPRCSKDNHVITTVNDLCEECREITKYEIQKIGKCESIVKRFTVGGYDSKKLLFGRGESDVEETLQRRVTLGNIDDIINGVEHTRDTQMSVNNVNSSLISDSGRKSDATKRNNCVII